MRAERSDGWTALVDDAVHEINLRWGEPLDDSVEPEMASLSQDMVRETAEVILRPLVEENERLRGALRNIAIAAKRWGETR